MPARIAKFPPIVGGGFDTHAVLSSIPPPPPAPPTPIIPAHTWAVNLVNPAPGFAVSGKWSWHQVTTEGIGNIHHGYDWGMGQPHTPFPPVVATPSMAVRTLGSGIKYWLPSSPNKEPQDGSTPGGKNSVAVSTPSFVTSTQDCMDINLYAFVAPTSVSYQLVSSREVGFTLGDLAAGALGMVGDAAGALASSALGRPSSSEITNNAAEVAANQLQSAVVGAFMAPVTNWAKALIPPPGPDATPQEKAAVGALNAMIDGAAALGAGNASDGVGAFAKGALGTAGSMAGGAAQEAIDGEREGDPEAMEHGGTPLFD